jgi:hypothetical protein
MTTDQKSLITKSISSLSSLKEHSPDITNSLYNRDLAQSLNQGVVQDFLNKFSEAEDLIKRFCFSIKEIHSTIKPHKK